MTPRFRFFNTKLNEMLNVIIIDLYNEQVNCVLDKQYADVITCNIKDGALMQSTGLKDNNNNEIFKGDIIKTTKGIKYGVTIGVVDYSEMLGLWYLKIKEDYDVELRIFDEKEVIGNIYEHHDLLK